jgi:thioredoxin-like negative regulator of GroEL
LKGLLEVLKKSGQKDDAFKVLTQLVRVLPEDRDLRMQLAVELHNRGRYAEAEKHLDILLQQDTDK